MKRYLRSFTALAALALLLSQPLAAQDKNKDKDKEKSKLEDNEEIIIKRKGDKNTKVIIEIKDDEVLVNGKPLEDYDDDNIVIRKGKGYPLPAPHSPFRGGALSMDDNFAYGPPVNKAFLGVMAEKTENGVKIEKITDGSGADKAGLKEGDVISKIDETKIETPVDLTKAIGKHKPEEKITITYERNGKKEQTTATLGKMKRMTFNFETPGMGAMPNMPNLPNFNWDWNDNIPHNFLYGGGRPRLGIKAQDTEEGKGVKVLDVDEESAAEKAGIKEDDVITEFDGKKVNTTDELAAAARDAREKASVKITFNRNGKSQTVEVKTPKKLKTANL